MKTNLLMLVACLSMSGIAMAEHHEMPAMSADHKMDMSSDHKMDMSSDHKMGMKSAHKKMPAAHKKMHADKVAKHHDMSKHSMMHPTAQAAIVPTQASMTGNDMITAPSAKEMMTPEQVRALEAQRWSNAGQAAGAQNAAEISAPPVPTMAQMASVQVEESKTVSSMSPAAATQMNAPVDSIDAPATDMPMTEQPMIDAPAPMDDQPSSVAPAPMDAPSMSMDDGMPAAAP